MFRQEQGSYTQIPDGDLGNGLIGKDCYTTISGVTYRPDFRTDTAYKNVPTEQFEVVEPDETLRFLDRLEIWKRQRLLTGWRFGAISSAATASCVFLINLIVTIWAVSVTKVDLDGKGVLYDGSCAKIKEINSGVHLLINVLSTLLLSGSNYCMQCLSAPTRRELDRAHMKKKWLDIGVPSLRNLTRISRKRVFLWIILGTSSLPLHLFYNSAVFASTSANEYKVFSVNAEFLMEGGSGILKNTTYEIAPHRPTIDRHETEILDPFNLEDYELAKHLRKLALAGKLERLEPSSCINAYAKLFQSERGNLLLVSEADSPMPSNFTIGWETFNSSVTANFTINFHNFVYADKKEGCPPDNFAWICGGSPCHTHGPDSQYCTDVWPAINASDWTPFGHKVDYCLSDRPIEHCRLHFSVHIAVLVIVLNLIKALAMAYTAFGVRETPLMTVGDAIASYVERPDPSTADSCLLAKADIEAEEKGHWSLIPRHFSFVRMRWIQPKKYDGTRQRWHQAVSYKRWITCLVMYIFALALVASLLAIGIIAIEGLKGFHVLIALGFGGVSGKTLITWGIPSLGASGLIANVVLANLAQPILSFLYFSYNGLITCFLLAYEWSQFAVQRKGLRVSTIPHGSQRSTYFLQLPYRYAMPLLVVSGLLHWLVSQSIFLVNLEVYDPHGQPAHHDRDKDIYVSDIMTCGYSPIAIICVLCIGGLLVAFGFVLGLQKFRSGMPIAGSCSAAIAAACHPPPNGKGDDGNVAGMPLMWGVTERPGEGDVYGHVAFSSREVEEPVEGLWYAGSRCRTSTQ